MIEVPSVGNVILEEVEKCEGEARADNRKGKLIFFYEWDIAVKWKGHANGKDTEVDHVRPIAQSLLMFFFLLSQVTGKIEIPNLSEEHEDMEDVDVDVSLTTKGPEATVLKEMLRKGPGAKKVRELLSNYVLALKNEYSSGLILPKKDQAAPPVKTTAVSKPASKLAGGQANEVQ